ncbi:MAG: pgaC 2 [Verrucomicrobiales bacterium]|nr:pgaC 2 [Verrucomicrobiales bacterium]
MISFIVPAHNEQACLGPTLRAIHESGRAIGQPYEIVVVDDASTDATAEIARDQGARVVSVQHRQIAATRNSGARAAEGDRLFFVDADTTVNPRAVTAGLRAMDRGAVGGGGPTWIDWKEPVPLYIRLVALLSLVAVRLIRFSGGAFMFCTRTAFHASGGFSERLFWGEEGSFALALKRQGKFVGLTEPVLTSGRRFRKTSALDIFFGGVRMIVSPVKMTTERSSVKKIWYDSNRTDDDKMPTSLVARLSNGVALLVLLVTVTGPVWYFVPPTVSSPFRQIRLAAGIYLCHLGLIFWPITVLLAVNLMRQKRWSGTFHTFALIALCLWQAWDSSLGVVWVWKTFAGWAMAILF